MSPTPSDSYATVIDISRHQGNVDFGKMRAKGVDGLIIRSNHAHIQDDRCAEYVIAARLHGWRDDQLGFYTFANPKRATGYASGKAFVDTVRQVFGRTDTILMLDVEGYASESGAGPILKGAEFAAWIREHIRAVRELAPDGRLIAYSNASFWNPWVGDQTLADELEWIVPRYPIYSPGGYVGNPVPAPGGWAGWAWRVGPKGPIPPSGATWAGWQFSAGHNGQGPVYGCQSGDLDLNIVELETWRRWTRTGSLEPQIPPIVNPPVEEPVPAPYIFKLASGQHGIRHDFGCRYVDGFELAGPFDGEPVFDVPAESNWEGWILAELAEHNRRIYPPLPAPGTGGADGEQTVRVDVNVTGP